MSTDEVNANKDTILEAPDLIELLGRPIKDKTTLRYPSSTIYAWPTRCARHGARSEYTEEVFWN